MNNRKRTRGRKFHYMEVAVKDGDKLKKARDQDRGMNIHRTVKYLDTTCPQTGAQTFRRDGRGQFVRYASRSGFIPQQRTSTIRLINS